MKTCHMRLYRNIWKFLVFWFTYRTIRMSCSSRKRSISVTTRQYTTGTGDSSSIIRLELGLRVMIAIP
jgi:hypothetical protein